MLIYCISMKALKYLLVCFFIALVGCATTQNYEKILASWVGRPVNALIDSWGPPDSEYVNGSTRYLTWVKGGNVFVPGTSPTYTTTIVGNTAYTNATGGSPAYNIQLSCKTTFTVRDGYVLNWRWEGNHCKARDPK